MPTQTRSKWCPECHRMVGVGCACGMSYRDKLRSVQVDYRWMEREKKNYYDQSALDDLVGEDAKERMLDETEGVGAYTAEDRRNFPGVESFYMMGGESDE